MKRALAGLVSAAVAASLVLVFVACEKTDASVPPVADASDALGETAAFDATVDVRDTGIDGTTDAGPPAGNRDRAGRPFITRLLVSEANRDTYNEVDNGYVIADTARGKGASAAIGADMAAHLAALDALDGKADLADAGFPNLAGTLLADAILLDPSKPFAPDGYLDLELHGAAHTTSGGRPLQDDALDKTLSWFVRGAASGVSDAVTAPSSPPSSTFPYLAPPP